jgi:hypothetical protein
MAIPEQLDHEIRARARFRCEYCLVPQSSSKLTFPIDHVIARQHGGRTEEHNLALCCGRCNLHKGPNLAGIDPVSNVLTRLFNPRTDRWSEHFRYRGAILLGLTDIGRTTIVVLNINHPLNVADRGVLMNAGLFFD